MDSRDLALEFDERLDRAIDCLTKEQIEILLYKININIRAMALQREAIAPTY